MYGRSFAMMHFGVLHRNGFVYIAVYCCRGIGFGAGMLKVRSLAGRKGGGNARNCTEARAWDCCGPYVLSWLLGTRLGH